ncbi:hypothetical protein Tco_1086172, partial [Tanacetum coccineum]
SGGWRRLMAAIMSVALAGLWYGDSYRALKQWLHQAADSLQQKDQLSVCYVTPRQGGNARRKQEWISLQHMVSP